VQARDRWLTEGMPPGTGLEESTITFDGNTFFGLDPQVSLNLNLGMLPPFEPVVLQEDELTQTIRDANGVTQRAMRDGSSMPRFMAFPVHTREDFARIKRRYDPSTPQRYPADWSRIVAAAQTGDCPVWGPGIGSIGFYSQMRTWMGTENACTVFYDDPRLAHEMVELICDFGIAALERALHEVRLDYFIWWEDFSFKNGPLVSPRIFREFLLPGYRRANDVLRAYGIDIIFLDTDGDPRVLIPLLMQSGINCLYPLEQCTEGLRPKAIRQEYGHDLLLWGGIDKRALTRGRAEIEEELYSKLPELLEDGGYIPQLDHLAPPDIPYANWLYYLELKRELCGGHHA
jgi:uroporphyrinogen decarboxylase